MKLIIGLGNPGSKYIHNRHNVGYLFIDFLKDSGAAQNDELLKTNTFMNDSGVFVKKVLATNSYPLDALYIAHDDLDLKLGEYKIQFGVGPKVHNGINSVESALGTKDFWRIRIGVDNRKNDDEGGKYVLEDFTDEELKTLEGVYAKIRDDLAKS